MKMLNTARIRPFLVHASILLLLSFGVSLAQAQTFGRISLTIVDAEGQSLSGAEIHATCAESTRFDETTRSNKKGRANIAVVDATKRYDLEISLDGYQTLKTQVKPELGSTTFRELVLLPVDVSPAATPAAGPAASDGGARLTPAETAFNEGIALAREDDFVGAKAEFLAAIEQDAELVPAHAALAGIYLDDEDFEAGLASADLLLALEPENVAGLRSRYEALQGLGRSREAKQALTALTALGGEGAAMVYNQGVSALRNGDLTSASASFEEALNIDPNLVPALTAYAAIHMDKGSYAEAAALAERALVVDPDQKRALTIRYDAYRAAGDETKATEAFAALAAANPQALFKDLYEKGVAQFNAGDSATAKESFQRCIEIDSEHAKVRYHLGLVLSSLGETDGAKQHLEKFVALAPDDPDAGAARDMLEYLQ